MKMKSLADLEAIRQRTLDKVNLRREHEGTRISVGMATCGIAAGARPCCSPSWTRSTSAAFWM